MPTKKTRSRRTDRLRKEYVVAELKHPVRGKHYARTTAVSNLVLLDPDVARAFPTADAVHDALRLLMRIARVQVRTGKKPRRRVS